jgi:hypothetical protein
MEKNELLEHVLDMEWEMFAAVKSAQPVSCQSSPDKFRAIRGSVFEMWSDEMLASYLIQLTVSKMQGRNLLTEKYARMDNLIPPLTESPFLDEIVEINELWQNELQKNFPALYKCCCRSTEQTGDGRNFSVYLRSELETYGDNTLELYYAKIKHAYDQKRNLSIEALQHLIEKSGYKDLEHAESCLS